MIQWVADGVRWRRGGCRFVGSVSIIAILACQDGVRAETWNLNANGNWGVAGNWLPATAPNAVGATANFGTVITAPRTVTVNIPVTLGTLNLSGTQAYTLGGANSLTFDASTGNASLGVSGTAAHTISAPITLNDTLALTNASPGALTVSGAIGGTGGLTVNAGVSTVNLNGLNSYTGATQITNGTVSYGTGSAIPAASVVTLGDGAGAAGTARLNINVSINPAQGFALSVASDGFLMQGNNRFVRLGSASGLGELRVNTQVGNGFEFLGTADASYGGVISGGIITNLADPNAGSRILKSGSATQTFTGANTFVGRVFINTGALRAASNTALGAVSAGQSDATFVYGTGSLELVGGISTAERIYLNGAGNGTAGALRSFSGNNTVTGNVSLGWSGGTVTASDASIGVDAGSTLAISGVISGANRLTKDGAGTLLLNTAGTWTGGTTFAEGILRLGVSAAVPVASALTFAGGTFDLNGFSRTLSSLSGFGGLTLGTADVTIDQTTAGTFSGPIIGTGSLTKQGAATLILTGESTYSGGTIITGGRLQLGSGGTTGSIVGDVVDEGVLAINRADIITLDGAISGSGQFTQIGNGTTILTGVSSYTGATNVDGGALLVEGSLGNTQVGVASGATLGGSGSIAGDVTIADGATLAPGSSAGTLALGSLTLNGGSILDYELGQAGVVGGGVNDLIGITGNLVLDGTLNITDIGGFGPGVYRLMNYIGTLTNNVLEFGGLPAGVDVADLFVQTASAGQINLINSTGAVLNFWDGGDSALHDNSAINGGAGVWDASNRNWTQADGAINGRWNQDFAVFGGQAGTVTVDDTAGDIFFTGMQFITDGYVVEGDALTTDTADTIIRTDAGVTARIVAAIDGTGGLIKQDTGTLILSGLNSYSGGTSVLNGTLQVSADANLGAASGRLTLDGGALQNTASFSTARNVSLGSGGGTFETETDLTVSGPISGAGALTKAGTASLTLTGANSYAGNTRVQEGRLIGNAASIRGDIANEGTVIFDQASNATFAGDISGSGTMIKDGTGTLVLSGLSAPDWTIDMGGVVTAAERFTGNVSIGTASSLTFDQAAAAIYAGVITGSGGFVKNGSGGLILSGNSAAFSGTTTISAGTLAVNGSLGGMLDVLDGGRLEGTGTVGSTTVGSGGTIAPGNSIGTLRVAGDYTQRAGSTYEAEIEPGGTSDLIDVTGTASIEGGTVFAVKAQGGYDAGTRYTILTADSGVTGTYDRLDQNAPFVDLLLAYDPNAIYLDVTRNDVSFCDVAVSANQCAVGGGAESLGPSNPIYDAIVGIQDDETARDAFDHLSGEMQASLKGAMLEDSRFVREAATARLRAAFGAVASPSLPVMGYGPEQVVTREGKSASVFAPASSNTDRFAVWAQGFGSWGEWDGDGNAASLDRSIGGLLIGADGFIAETWRLGVVAGFSQSSFDVDARASSGDSDDYHLGFYSGTQWGALGFRTGAAYSWHNIETARSVAFPGFTDQLSAEYDAGTAQVFGELGYKIDRDNFAFEPFANLAYVNVHTDGFREHGGDAALTSPSSDTDATFTTLGLRASSDISTRAIQATAIGMVGWRHAFGDVNPWSSFAFAGSDEFTIAGTPLAEDSLVLEAGLDVGLSAHTSLGITYSGQIASKASDHGFRADFSLKF